MQIINRFLLGSAFVFAIIASVKDVHAKTERFESLFPSLPQQYRDNHFKEVQRGFEERASLHLKGKNFHSWKPNRSENEILEEYKTLDEWRHHTWYSEATKDVLISRPDFIVAQDILEKGYFKKPRLITFNYNKTDSTFNASSIVLNGYRFLALEGPSTNTLGNFFRLLQNHQVTQLVRLTAAEENGHEKSYPYWEGNVNTDPNTKQDYLNVHFYHPLKSKSETPSYKLRYYPLNSWQDNRGIDPKILLNLIETVRKDFDSKNGLLACHCSAGVGRTGTFIAGFLLIQEIDRQIAAGVPIEALDLSIEKIVTQLSLQRVHMVAKAPQYVTLYRLVDLYVENLKNKRK